ncbi:MAG: hypothetical protein ACLFS3_01030 [Candidatus Aenigmatarchaeota archaeon]
MEEGETFEIDEPHFQCVVCEEEIEFSFDEEDGLEPGEISEEVREEIGDEFIPSEEDFAESDVGMEEPGVEGSEMKIICDCGAEYIVRKTPGVPGFEVSHTIESEPELAEKEFEDLER